MSLKETLERMTRIIQTHEALLIAIEDFGNMGLNGNAHQRLAEAVKKSRQLLEEDWYPGV
jgi:hypothetical protein